MSTELPAAMPAWRFDGVDRPLRLEEVPVPVPRDNEVLVRVRASGLCHTDIGIMSDDTWSERIAELPLTLGHEIAGEVVQVANQVRDISLGDRVGVTPAGESRPGLGRDGGYASYCVVAAEDLIAIPNSVSFEHAALGTDAGRASFRAVVRQGGAKAGDRVGLIGLGGLGQLGARIAVLLGAEVFAVDVKPDAAAIAREIGVHGFAEDIREFKDKNLDLIVDFAGFGNTTQMAIETVRPFGKVVQVGMARLQSTISTAELIFKQVTLVGSRGGTNQDIADLYEMFARGDLDPRFERAAFDQIPAALERLKQGNVKGRLVVTEF